MARPRSSGIDYFPHDCDAASDEKIAMLRAEFGNDGYAFYFILLERIYHSSDKRLILDSPLALKVVLDKLMISEDKFSAMMTLAVQINLFNGTAWDRNKTVMSTAIHRRVKRIEQERIRKRKEPSTYPFFQRKNHGKRRIPPLKVK